ncbi:hypothetical protein AJ78_01348 [Emergomyces pasteurianus Ep9510]|uniref:Uncharacterized protein n=1 Tax=Emergomyces pasteurianus Ep9510 TaxID=1447872 RepID=A0A1J9QRY4_9EURO|nr:hypothetical protein AJ78_01348 [Emergomyces pasteurianus Ep9510]
MNRYRALARESLNAVDDRANYRINTSHIEAGIRLTGLWSEISTNEPLGTTEKLCEDLLLIESVLRATKVHETLQHQDREAARYLIFWTARAVLPNETFTSAWEEAQFADGENATPQTSGMYKLARLKSNVGVSVLQLLNTISPVNELEVDDAIDVISCLAAFTCRKDPWTTEQAFTEASNILQSYESLLCSKSRGKLATVLEDILRKKVKPLFSKTKTPAITAVGRKNLHPIPQPRFDPSIFDPDSKPWKFKDVYVITLLSWVIGRYLPSDKLIVESHLPLLVPAILSLIDDESLPFKAKGCELLSKFLAPLEQSNSDILRRTNLDSVFQDALNPCLLLLPTITPEPESIHLLQYAYPAFLAIIRTRFPSSRSSSTPTAQSPAKVKPKEDPEFQKRLECLTHLLRNRILHSYYHTSNPRPIENTSISSYPCPRLSALLLSQLQLILLELGIHTTKHLQDLVPMVSATLSNPFGTAYTPLLAAAAEVARIIVLNAWPRIVKWRAELLSGMCTCWLHVCDDMVDIDMRVRDADSSGRRADLSRLQLTLKEVVGMLKIVIEECSDLAAGEEGGDETRGWGGDRRAYGYGEVIDVDREFGKLVQGDERLRGLLIDNEYAGPR